MRNEWSKTSRILLPVLAALLGMAGMARGQQVAKKMVGTIPARTLRPNSRSLTATSSISRSGYSARNATQMLIRES